MEVEGDSFCECAQVVVVEVSVVYSGFGDAACWVGKDVIFEC